MQDFINTNLNLILISMLVVGLLFILLLCVCLSIISINKNIKRFVDLEYKKYKEENAKNAICSQSRSDRPTQS